MLLTVCTSIKGSKRYIQVFTRLPLTTCIWKDYNIFLSVHDYSVLIVATFLVLWRIIVFSVNDVRGMTMTGLAKVS